VEILNGELWKSQCHQVVFALGCQITEPNQEAGEREQSLLAKKDFAD
jgi:hypothetical protein